MSSIKNTNVLVTGGASGIGKIMGLKCLQEGCATLTIWDINQENLLLTQKEFSNRGYNNVHTFIVDVSDVNDIERAATEVLLNIGNIDILINNAGIVAGKKNFWEYSTKEIEQTFAINVSGVMHVTRVFIKEMLQQQKGHVVNIASASALIGLPKGSVYASSKWAVMGWSESLRLELAEEHENLQVTTVCPSYIDTGMFKGVKAPMLFPLLQPEEISKKIIEAIKNNQPILMQPDNVNLVPFLKGMFPTKIFDSVANWLGVYSSMNSFEGRADSDKSTNKKSNKAVK